MGDLTWVMVLGAIAIITPIVFISISDYVDQPIESIEKVYTIDDLDYNEVEYNLISNMTCSNIFDNNTLNITNFELLEKNQNILLDGLWSINKNDIQIACFFDNSYIEDRVDNHLMNETEMLEQLNPDSDEGKTRNFFSRMNPSRFFDVLNEFPSEIKYIIYTFYILFFGYLIYKAVTLA